jgi:hypothetical protein
MKFSDYCTDIESLRHLSQSTIRCLTASTTTQYELEFGEVEKMSKEYPALKKALENVKTVYEIVKDDYANKNRN